ncbi:MAG TPA: hypothetical protein VKX25_09190 [Bryobacteraceae bacterium]|nr:hypothetical protein [Bryobacteraceae bacterium]
MRTTLELDDDLLHSAKELAKAHGHTIGETVSELIRLGLSVRRVESTTRNGVPLFTPIPAAKRPDLALVNALRDES